MKRATFAGWCISTALAAGSTCVAQEAIVVHVSGLTAAGQLLSQDSREIVFHAEGAPHEVHLQMQDVAKVIETDEHGGDKALAARVAPSWNVLPEPQAPRVVAPDSNPTYYLIPLHGEVGATILASALEKSLADAVIRKPTVVVLEIDSPGGLVDEAQKIAKVLHKYNKKLRIVALTDQDLSAAAILTLSIREVYVKSSSTIGAATAYRTTLVTLPPKLEEKMQSAWRAVARNSAEEGGHEPLLAEAMIDNDIELHLEIVNGKPVVREGPGEKTLCRKGKVLTLSSHEAVSCGLANGEADDLDELSKELKLDGWRECPGLGTLMAAYLPKRDAQFETIIKRLSAQFQQSWERAKEAMPADEVTRTLVRSPQRYIRTGNMIRPVPGSSTVVTKVSHDHWNEKSLQCVIALQQAEENLADEQALCKAFGQEGLYDLMSQAAVEVGAMRARIYDDRNRYGVPGMPAHAAPTPPQTNPAHPQTNPAHPTTEPNTELPAEVDRR